MILATKHSLGFLQCCFRHETKRGSSKQATSLISEIQDFRAVPRAMDQSYPSFYGILVSRAR
jgi:hypothetical protein